MSLLSNIRSFMRFFRGDQAGSVAIEFAIMAPVLLVVLLPATWETINAVMAKRKINQTANVLADLATQSSEINQASWKQLSSIVDLGVYPYNGMNTRLRLIGVRVDANSRIRTAWDYGTAELDPTAIPTNLIIPNSFYVMAAAEMDYVPFLAESGFGKMTFRDTAFLSPRVSQEIELR